MKILIELDLATEPGRELMQQVIDASAAAAKLHQPEQPAEVLRQAWQEPPQTQQPAAIMQAPPQQPQPWQPPTSAAPAAASQQPWQPPQQPAPAASPQPASESTGVQPMHPGPPAGPQETVPSPTPFSDLQSQILKSYIDLRNVDADKAEQLRAEAVAAAGSQEMSNWTEEQLKAFDTALQAALHL